MRIFNIFLFCLFTFSVTAQQPAASRSELEKKRQNILDAIRVTQEQLEITKKDKKATMGELRALQNKLAERQKLINNINQEIGAINANINYSEKEIYTLRQELNMLKIRYAQSIRYAYKNRSSYNMLAFLFSSKDFNEAIRRLRYLKKYRDYRKEQADQIRLTHSKIAQKLGVLNNVKSEKDKLLSVETEQKQVIQKETNEKDRVVQDLQGREKELIADIARNKKIAKQVDAAISKVIMREIELAKKKAEEEARRKAEEEERKRKLEEQQRLAAANSNSNISVMTGSGTRPAVPSAEKPATGTKPAAGESKPIAASSTPTRSAPSRTATATYINTLTPEVAALSNSFEMNRGKLPWPVDKGYISSKFGKHAHEVAKKVEIDNNGIDITTNPGTVARAVFSGTVSKVFFIPGANWIVTINHGAYFTVYSGLVNVTVKSDQQVSTKQALGTVGPNDDGVILMNFQIWKIVGRGPTKVDPEQWIASQ